MSDSAHPTLATFRVHRDQDVSGISGTGVVAEGVQFSDGWVVTHWLDQAPMWEPKTDVWHHKGTRPITKVHGHGGVTRIVWTSEEERQRRDIVADVFDRIERGIHSVQDYQAAPVEVGEERIADGATPVVVKVLEQRDRMKATVERARALADRWQAAHGSSMFLVRAAGTELQDVLDDTAGEGQELPAAECSAEHHDIGHWRTRQCIRAAQHRGVHLDDRGFQWPDSMATYPIFGGRMRCGRASANCANPDHACKVCGDCMYQHPGEGGCADAEQLPADQGLLSGVEVRAACPYCTGTPMFPRQRLRAHIEEQHARVLAVLASGGSLDGQLAEPETRCRLPHEMEA
ncbi:hypothetical protein [Streptomyces mirabilis]|uniref:hypothetical protein n=1 Tax=Streptomyces mirabilis TaxID=68239 RepID=UPI0036B8B784